MIERPHGLIEPSTRAKSASRVLLGGIGMPVRSLEYRH